MAGGLQSFPGDVDVSGNETVHGSLLCLGSSTFKGTTTFNGAVIGLVTTLTVLTASLGADVALSNTALYFDGPSVAQGTVGIWFVSGNVSILDTTGAATFTGKLWDGATVISSAMDVSGAVNQQISLAFSGVITSPAGNLRISIRDASTATGKILFNASGNSKDSNISAFRIG